MISQSPWSSIGLKLDVRDLYKVEFDTSGLALGGYGVAAYFLFWSLLDPKVLAGAILSSGDVRTSPDTGDWFCIGVQHRDHEFVERLQRACEVWPPFIRAGLSFLDSHNLHKASLPDDAYIDHAGEVRGAGTNRPVSQHFAEGLWKARGIDLRELRPQSIAGDSRQTAGKRGWWQSFWRATLKPAVAAESWNYTFKPISPGPAPTTTAAPEPKIALADVLTFWTSVAGGVNVNADKKYEVLPGTGESMHAEERDQFQRLIAFGPSAIPDIENAALDAFCAQAGNPASTDNANAFGYERAGYLCLALGAIGTAAAYDALRRMMSFVATIDPKILRMEPDYVWLLRRIYIGFELLAKSDPRAKNVIRQLNQAYAGNLHQR